MAQVMAVGTSKDATAAVIALMDGDAGAQDCANCISPCGSAADVYTCVMSCTTNNAGAAAGTHAHHLHTALVVPPRARAHK